MFRLLTVFGPAAFTVVIDVDSVFKRGRPHACARWTR
jgi:hypothetical protein